MPGRTAGRIDGWVGRQTDRPKYRRTDRQTELGKGAKFGLNERVGEGRFGRINYGVEIFVAVITKSTHVPNTHILPVCFKLSNSDEYGLLGCNAV
jgi:hypothetical protein